LKEKTLAAHREGIKTVLYPKANQKDLEDIPAEIRAELTLVPVENFDEVVNLVLSPNPELPKGAPGTPPWIGGPTVPPPPPGGLA